ncbi:MAG: transposase, partial [Cellvibrionaceae bacterium]|nr:transposase [Cellvibrionaceae bacterium]
CYAYCLMGNHYHLLVETPEANLSKGMQKLNGVYTQRFNRKYGRVGHVFQGRYKSILVDKDSYLLELCRYIVLNPVRAGLVRTAKDWPWSSYRATIGAASSPDFLSVEQVLAAFAARRAKAIERYANFVSQGQSEASPWEHLQNQAYLGDKQFIEGVAEKLSTSDLDRLPSPQVRQVKALADYEQAGENRNAAIYAAHRSGGYSLKELGEYFGLHYSTVSSIIKSQRPDPKAKGLTPKPTKA